MFQPIAVYGPGCGRNSTAVRSRPTASATADAVAVGLDPGLDAVPCTDQGAGVVVDAQHVKRHRDGRLVAVVDEGPVGDAGGVGEAGRPGRRRRASGRGRPGWPARRSGARRRDPRRLSEAGTQHVQVERHRQLRRRGQLPDDPAGQSVREVEVVDGGQRGRRLGAARRVHARGVAEEGRAPRLVERRPECAPGRRAHRRWSPRSRRTAARCPARASRRRPPAPAAGPSGRASRPARTPRSSSPSTSRE